MDVFGENVKNWDVYRDQNLDHVQEMLVRVGNPNRPNFGGVTLFHEAINIPSDNIRVVRNLMNAGADVNLRTHLDLSPLHFAVYFRKQEVFEALIQSGASVNTKDFLGRTILHFAVSRVVKYYAPKKIEIFPEIEILSRLLHHEDIDINAVDFNGETPLMKAVKQTEIMTTIQLLRNKANPNICNHDLETPLHAAFSVPWNYDEVLLLLNGASIYALDKNGQTPLDIFLKSDRNSRPPVWKIRILYLTAFRYNITSDLKRKFKVEPELWDFLNKYSGEVDHMRNDFIFDKITMHDFCMDCYNEDQFKHVLHIHTPVVERLVRDIYPEYLFVILRKIPELSLFSILQNIARTRKIKISGRKVKDLADLFSLLEITFLFSKYLSKLDFFCLIVALSDVINVESMENLYKRYSFFNVVTGPSLLGSKIF